MDTKKERVGLTAIVGEAAGATLREVAEVG